MASANAVKRGSGGCIKRCASSQLNMLAALWTGPSMKTSSEARPGRVPTSSSATVAPHEAPTTMGFSRPSPPNTKSASLRRMADGRRYFFLFWRRLALICGRALAPPDQQCRQRGESQDRKRHIQGELHSVDEAAHEDIVGKGADLMLHGGRKARGQLGSVLARS